MLISVVQILLAEVAKNLGKGGQSLAEKELGWNRRIIASPISSPDEMIVRAMLLIVDRCCSD
ncbi:MAG: hypothetical protein H0X31_18910 [Nostocaceae cyanobacterium]|nr:hypothetical protein [Nostocaceae cyanobacterium]